jgi:hypothetical protein
MSLEGEVPTEYEAGPGYIVSTWRNALLMLWSGAVTSQGLDATERAGLTLERRHGWQVAVSVSLPRVAMSVTVIEGDGFWLSAGRMVMTALVTLSGGKTKPVIAKSIDEAAPLIHPHLTPKATLSEVVRALRAFRG